MRKMIIMTAPSGAGKTTIVRHLLEKIDQLAFSVSATTRTPRKGEVDGKDYYFLSEKKFKKKIAKGAFAEWEEVYPGKYYGTLKKEIKRVWKEGKDVIFDIEVKGATNMKRIYKDKALAIFIKPPSIEELLNRLQKRDTESTNSIKERISRAKKEMTYQNNFDVVLINDVLPIALIEAEEIALNFLNQKTATKIVAKEKSITTKKKKEKEKKKKKEGKSKKKKSTKKNKEIPTDINW